MRKNCPHWGKWRVNSSAATLAYQDEGAYYAFKLGLLTSPAQVPEWVAAVSGKPWCSLQDAADLYAALHELLGPAGPAAVSSHSSRERGGRPRPRA
jgi:hypothetical protein